MISNSAARPAKNQHFSTLLMLFRPLRAHRLAAVDLAVDDSRGCLNEAVSLDLADAPRGLVDGGRARRGRPRPAGRTGAGRRPPPGPGDAAPGGGGVVGDAGERPGVRAPVLLWPRRSAPAGAGGAVRDTKIILILLSI